MRNAGLPTGGDPQGNGVSVVVGVRESLTHGEGGQVVRWPREPEVREMRDAERTLAIIRDRGSRGVARRSSSAASATRGSIAETRDGMIEGE